MSYSAQNSKDDLLIKESDKEDEAEDDIVEFEDDQEEEKDEHQVMVDYFVSQQK